MLLITLSANCVADLINLERATLLIFDIFHGQMIPNATVLSRFCLLDRKRGCINTPKHTGLFSCPIIGMVIHTNGQSLLFATAHAHMIRSFDNQEA